MLCSFCILVMLLIRFVLPNFKLNPRFCKRKTQHIVYVPGSASLQPPRCAAVAAYGALHIANAFNHSGLPHYKQKFEFLAPSHGCVIQNRAIMRYTLFVFL